MDMIIDHAHETFVRWGHHDNQGWKSACCHHFLHTWPDFQSCDPSWPSSDVSMGVILHVAVLSGKIIHVFCASAKTFNLAFHKRCLKWDIWKLLHNSPCESLYVVGSLTDPFSRTQKWKCNENVLSRLNRWLNITAFIVSLIKEKVMHGHKQFVVVSAC